MNKEGSSENRDYSQRNMRQGNADIEEVRSRKSIKISTGKGRKPEAGLGNAFLRQEPHYGGRVER